MSVFESLDLRLEKVAGELNAILTKNRNGFSDLHAFEERRIDWVENGINKAIIIQPSFTVVGVDNSQWNFNLVAWIKRKGIAEKPGWVLSLLKNKEFSEIENNMEDLITLAKEKLKAITLDDV